VLASLPAGDGTPLAPPARAAIEARFEDWSREGVRVLALATRALLPRRRLRSRDEARLAFRGFLAFVDRRRAWRGGARTGALGVGIKLITGDAKLVALHVARAVGWH
jgi:Mg2+-importing ATPase